MEHLDAEETVRALDELQQHISHHYQWASALNRTLICGTPPEDDTLQENSHCLCKLGLWLTGKGNYFGKHLNFPGIVEQHRDMHDRARDLCMTAINGAKISESHYDGFLESLDGLRGKIEATHKELYDGIVRTDPLTGAATRMTMRTALTERLHRATADLQSDWFIMLDLDHFKRVNDSHGHLKGDEVLAGVGATIRSQIRTEDLFFRYGGEEFLLCISGVDRAQISDIAERIRASIERSRYPAADGSSFSVTCSSGIAALDPALEVAEALNKADAALYEAKKAGRNAVRIFEEPTADRRKRASR